MEPDVRQQLPAWPAHVEVLQRRPGESAPLDGDLALLALETDHIELHLETRFGILQSGSELRGREFRCSRAGL